jgi:hypothetical protein
VKDAYPCQYDLPLPPLQASGRNKIMTDTQLYLSIGVPMLFNAGLIGILVAYINSLGSRLQRVEDRLDHLVGAINELYKRLTRVEIKLGIQP